MNEREKRNQSKKDENTVHHLPPAWCGSMCRNAMSEVCIEECAIERDCSGFDAKPNLKLEDMPRFPLKGSANMTKEEKFTSVTVYLAKVVDQLKGVDNEPFYPPIIRRKDVYRAKSKDSKVENLLSQAPQSTHPTTVKSNHQKAEENLAERPEKMTNPESQHE